MNHKKGFSTLVGVIITLLVIGGIVFVIKNHQSKSPVVSDNKQNVITPTPSPASSVSTAGWKVYQNKKCGYEFKYPNGWSLDTSDPDRTFLSLGDYKIQIFSADFNFGETITDQSQTSYISAHYVPLYVAGRRAFRERDAQGSTGNKRAYGDYGLSFVFERPTTIGQMTSFDSFLENSGIYYAIVYNFGVQNYDKSVITTADNIVSTVRFTR